MSTYILFNIKRVIVAIENTANIDNILCVLKKVFSDGRVRSSCKYIMKIEEIITATRTERVPVKSMDMKKAVRYNGYMVESLVNMRVTDTTEAAPSP